MKKVLSFSVFLLVGLAVSQVLPFVAGDATRSVKVVTDIFLYICLAFIMINVGREFEIDKSRWKSYALDYFVAMVAAAMPWLLIALYYIFVLFPSTQWGSGDLWKETLLISRFAAPTSAGILFTMLAALKLKSSWMYKKIQVLAIFDDLDTILLMIPLQVFMIGMKWQMAVILTVVIFLLVFGWKQMGRYGMRQDWKAILGYSVIVIVFTQGIYHISEYFLGPHEGIHIEVLLPAFVLGMVMKPQHIESRTEEKVSTAISYFFMFLVGVSMPQFIGLDMNSQPANPDSVTASLPMMSWGMIAVHVVVVSLLSNIGKLMPLAFYRDRKFSERLALSIGMFTRGEVGAGVIFIAISYNLGGPLLLISVLTIVLNLILTGGFVMLVKKLALKTYTQDA
ncbi:MAG: sodium:proton antiporter [Candidatus Cryptobacteroides sp.]|nr:cation:proton antiporter [Bacteroidales bacterium]MDD7132920.1 sodium:proton antiporter [Bacteroidales bacterium]MDY2774615.1 sodium:proton antiporter [Candidatus Cryptobacteroides sp.]